MANISHEIRTPLTGILGVMHLLKRTELDRNQHRYVDTATNSSKMLLAITSDLLTYARPDTDGYPLESESLDLVEVIEDVSSILVPEANKKGLDLICDIDPKIPHRIRGDALRLRQVLNSLLNNAIKHTEQGFIVIYVLRNGNSLELGVRDTASGLDDRQREKILRPIDELEQDLKLRSVDTGLGLMSSRRLIEAMGSRLKIESTVGKGSRFYFDLKIDSDQSAAFDWKPPQALQQLSVGILSPLAIQRSSIRSLLAHWNVGDIREVDFDVETGDEPPDMPPCDLLIIDQTDSEQAVNRLIDRLRNNSQWRDTRFVQLALLNRLSEGGSADLRLYKPISHSRMYTTVMDIVYKLAFISEYDRESYAPEAESRGILAGRRILLVEDNDINKMIVLEMLEETGADVDVALNGAEALDQIKRQDYDLILMDIQMPVMDGYQATRQIRAQGGALENIPIIAMTAHALEGDSGKSLAAGLDYHISKPFEPDDLIAIILRFIEDRKTAEPT